ncbi:MAG: cytochrome c4 [Marinobacter sp.]|jgi:cytochrome c553|uniref:c-type cytochrome n=1 Tax=Marinobacter TaxID=2742 RepID=UPI0007874E9B|nr:c-type cytochrome [Marinobacter sp. 3-2]MCG8523036.1 cytochrome c4 [Pseudomonadales bacterium]MCK5865770.1 cytochrome c4 [Marinobacter adhaerens]MTI78255.1 cytochrome c4 [Marinobacter sp.]PHS46801.1 MAG: cytochrome c4 [Marinobacter sp.]ROQ44992.1 cytochrome c553 [Marinobacter sp. 3-2]
MKKLIAGVVLGVGLTAMAHGAGDPQAGEQNAAVCAGCHGQGGAKPVMGVYPKLSGLGEKYLYRQLVAIKSKERNIPEMTGILDNMSDQDLQDLAAYFDSQEMVVSQADPDLVDQGSALYRGGNMATGVPACAGCHNPQGNGNAPAGYPALGGQNAEYLVKQLKAYRDGDRNNGANAAIMMDVAAKLTDAEIEAVSSYISGLN